MPDPFYIFLYHTTVARWGGPIVRSAPIVGVYVFTCVCLIAPPTELNNSFLTEMHFCYS